MSATRPDQNLRYAVRAWRKGARTHLCPVVLHNPSSRTLCGLTVSPFGRGPQDAPPPYPLCDKCKREAGL